MSQRPPLDRIGQRTARNLRQYQMDATRREQRRCDLDILLEELDIIACESEHADCGYVACLIRTSAATGMMLAPGQNPGRRRFSIAHELGHFGIPTHSAVGTGYWCHEADLRRRSRDAATREWEANDFAAELLMPTHRFAADLSSRSVTFATVDQLAASDMYDVSRTAAAWRVIQTSHEPCALFVAHKGQLNWAAYSRGWSYAQTERQRPFPAGSAGAAVISGESIMRHGEQIDPAVWLTSADGRWTAPTGTEVVESTHAVPEHGHVLSLVWVIHPD
jgi:Zn-dependent peptidase ImmA (M78 family)